jgi:2-succinyl-6-hydroxy-2,4-cyclohexadiene-1-carboxylate synthase
MTRSLFALHGFSGNGAIFERLAQDVTAPLLAGHGPSPNLEALTFFEEVDRLANLAEALPAPRWLAGYSQGARLGLGLLAKHPTLFERAYLFGVHPGLESAEERETRLRVEHGWQRLLRSGGLEAFVLEWERLPIFESQLSWPHERIERQRRVRLSNTVEGLVHALEVLGLGSMPNLRPLLGAVHIPVHLVAGELDVKFCKLHESVASRLPRASLEVLPGVGHNPLLEAAERVRAMLLPD